MLLYIVGIVSWLAAKAETRHVLHRKLDLFVLFCEQALVFLFDFDFILFFVWSTKKEIGLKTYQIKNYDDDEKNWKQRQSKCHCIQLRKCAQGCRL